MKAVFMPNRRDDGLLRIVAAHPELDWTIAGDEAERVAALAEAEILVIAEAVCSPLLSAALMRAPKLRWIQFCTAGMDHCIRCGLPRHIPVSGGSGVKAPTVAEHALTLLLGVARRLRALEAKRKERRWARAEMFPRITSLEGKTLVIVGYGHVGREVARKAHAFDMRIIVVSRAARPEAGLQAVLPRARLKEALAAADAVVICTAPSPETEHMIGAAELAVMKPGAIIVNVARGEMIDEPALIAALEEGRIAGAGLDVAATEPLPPDHRFWDMDTVLLTPHVGGGGGDEGGAERFARLFAENLRRFKAGERLLQQVDPETLQI